MEMPELPNENIFDILSRLPVKSLMRFKCVSKPWCSLISDPHFIKVHFSRLNQVSCKILVSSHTSASIIDYEDCENSIVELNYPVVIQTAKWNRFVGSCNGLVCLVLDSCTFILCNPSTREFRQVPPLIPSSYDIYETHDLSGVDFYGFGYDSSIDDYKIVIGIRPKFRGPVFRRKYCLVQCFSLKTNKWKSMGFHVVRYRFDRDRRSGIFLNGNLHWISETDKPKAVWLFNIKDEKFTKVVPLPADCHTQSYRMLQRLYAFENSLFLLNIYRKSDADTNHYIEVWEKNADAVEVEDSWKKLNIVRIRPYKPPYQLYFTRNHKLVLRVSCFSIATYNLKTRTSKDFQLNGTGSLDVIDYVETLVSPN